MSFTAITKLKRLTHKTALVVATPLLVQACTWVETTETGASVQLIRAEEATNCERIGSTTVSVKDSVGFLERDQGKVAIELQTLAQNAAAERGGNRIAAADLPADGVQEFTIFNCEG